MKYLLSVLLMILAYTSHAEEMLPEGCKPFHIEEESIVWPADKPTIIMIHNLTNGDLWLTHASTDSFADLNTYLQAGLWSALALDKNKFKLNCVESKPGHEQQVDCASVVAVCSWPTSKKPEKVAGIAWAGENMLLPALMAFVGRHGYELQTSEAQS